MPNEISLTYIEFFFSFIAVLIALTAVTANTNLVLYRRLTPMDVFIDILVDVDVDGSIETKVVVNVVGINIYCGK